MAIIPPVSPLIDHTQVSSFVACLESRLTTISFDWFLRHTFIRSKQRLEEDWRDVGLFHLIKVWVDETVAVSRQSGCVVVEVVVVD